MTASCQTCRFRDPDKRPDYADSGHCRRFPPVPSKINTPDGGVEWDNLVAWVGPSDWCGEWQAVPITLSELGV